VQYVMGAAEAHEEMQERRRMVTERWNAMSPEERERLARRQSFPKQSPVLMSQSLPSLSTTDEPTPTSDGHLVLYAATMPLSPISSDARCLSNHKCNIY